MADDDKDKIIEILKNQKQQKEDFIKSLEKEDEERNELLEAQAKEIKALKRDKEKKEDEIKKLREHLQRAEEEAEEMRKLAAFAATVRRVPKKSADGTSCSARSSRSPSIGGSVGLRQPAEPQKPAFNHGHLWHIYDEFFRPRDSGISTATTGEADDDGTEEWKQYMDKNNGWVQQPQQLLSLFDQLWPLSSNKPSEEGLEQHRNDEPSEEGLEQYSNNKSGKELGQYSNNKSGTELEQYSNDEPSEEELEQYSNGKPSEGELEQYSNGKPSEEELEQYSNGKPVEKSLFEELRETEEQQQNMIDSPAPLPPSSAPAAHVQEVIPGTPAALPLRRRPVLLSLFLLLLLLIAVVIVPSVRHGTLVLRVPIPCRALWVRERVAVAPDGRSVLGVVGTGQVMWASDGIFFGF